MKEVIKLKYASFDIDNVKKNEKEIGH